MCSLPLPQLLQASPLDCASTTSVTLLSRWSGGGLRELAQLTLRAMGLSTARRVVRTGASCIYANFHIITLWFGLFEFFVVSGNSWWMDTSNGGSDREDVDGDQRPHHRRQAAVPCASLQHGGTKCSRHSGSARHHQRDYAWVIIDYTLHYSLASFSSLRGRDTQYSAIFSYSYFVFYFHRTP